MMTYKQYLTNTHCEHNCLNNTRGDIIFLSINHQTLFDFYHNKTQIAK